MHGAEKAIAPTIGYHRMLNVEASLQIILEVTNSKALRDLLWDGAIDWVFMVCPGMAVVSPTMAPSNKDALDNLLQAVQCQVWP